MTGYRITLIGLSAIAGLVAFAAVGCEGAEGHASGDSDSDSDSDGDTDADTDGDSDVDTDGDTDGDSDGDSDGDTDECTVPEDEFSAPPECSEWAPPESFEPDVQWTWEGSGGDVYSIVTPLVANLTDDDDNDVVDMCDIPDVVVVASNWYG